MRFDDAGAVVQLYVERSKMSKKLADEPGADRFEPQSITTFTSQGTVRASRASGRWLVRDHQIRRARTRRGWCYWLLRRNEGRTVIDLTHTVLPRRGLP
jgi:hypothetical protein